MERTPGRSITRKSGLPKSSLKKTFSHGRLLPRVCLFCRKLFMPNPRTFRCQRFCSNPACQKASKFFSQYLWLAKPENRNHWGGNENVQRVQEWRKTHPFYWKQAKRRPPGIALQEMIVNYLEL
jgi:hypothetical protein